MPSKHLELPAASLHRLVFPWWIHNYDVKPPSICMRSSLVRKQAGCLSLDVIMYSNLICTHSPLEAVLL